VLFNTLVLGPAVTFLISPAWDAMFKVWGFSSAAERLVAYPSLWEFALSMPVYLIVEEIGFYYTHRAAHHPWLYGPIHKLHHTYKAPVAYTAVYAHPIEHMVCNIAPVVAGPVLMGSHPVTAAVWIVLALIYTTNSHCGYFLQPHPSPEGHDWHHEKTSEMFGVLGILDSWHGTDTKFQAEMARRDELQARRAKDE
jgi:fatty acid hydroxylase domain-containing protein 2